MVKTIKTGNYSIEVRLSPSDVGEIICVEEEEGRNMLLIDFTEGQKQDDLGSMGFYEDDYINFQKEMIKVRKEQKGVLEIELKGILRSLGTNAIMVRSFSVGIRRDEEWVEECKYPKVKDPNAIGQYPESDHSGGGYVWDEVLEYRVWSHPERGAPNKFNGDDYYNIFKSYEEALEFSQQNMGTEEPLALVLQEEYIDEPQLGVYVHVKNQRITEWPVEFLTYPRRQPNTIPDFLSPNAPSNRFDILRGHISVPKDGKK